MEPAPPAEPEPEPPDVDQAGVDRAQIRRMLALTPVERLRVCEEHRDALLAIRDANDPHAVR